MFDRERTNRVSFRTFFAGSRDMSDFDPIPKFNKPDADVNLVFLQNHALYLKGVKDPWFMSTDRRDYINEAGDKITTVYASSQANTSTTMMACTEQYQFCNKFPNKCTGLSSLSQISDSGPTKAIGLNSHQSLLATHLSKLLHLTTLQNLGRNLDGSNLLATQYQANVIPKHGWMSTTYGISRELPPDQWKSEIAQWLRIMTTALQQSAIDYAAGPTLVIEKPEQKPDAHSFEHDFCLIQITSRSDYTSLSLLGIVVMFAVGGIIILLDFFTPILHGFLLHRRRKNDPNIPDWWRINDFLQLQERAFGRGGSRACRCGGTPRSPILRRGRRDFSRWELELLSMYAAMSMNESIKSSPR
ncbi:MAG: hypothetical protein Q9160_001514 [Pyrenula sp. 1 TL-2023]